MMLALVNGERQRRQELRMIIHPLSDEFIQGSPEALPLNSFRMQPHTQKPDLNHSTITEFQGQ